MKELSTSTDARGLLSHWYDEYADHLHGYLLALLTYPSEAEDALQNVFMKTFSRLRKGHRPRDPAAYLFRAARNEAYSRVRSWTYRLRWMNKVKEEPALLHPLRNGVSLTERDTIEKALLQLPVKQREIVILKALEERTFSEISALIGVSPNTAASRYRYAIKKLRSILGQEDSRK